MSDSAIRKRVLRGLLHRRYRSVSSLGDGELTREGEWLAALLAVGEDAVPGRFSAAVPARSLPRRRAGDVDPGRDDPPAAAARRSRRLAWRSARR